MSRYIDADMFDDVIQVIRDRGEDISTIAYKRIALVLAEFPTVDTGGETKEPGDTYSASESEADDDMS